MELIFFQDLVRKQVTVRIKYREGGIIFEPKSFHFVSLPCSDYFIEVLCHHQSCAEQS